MHRMQLLNRQMVVSMMAKSDVQQSHGEWRQRGTRWLLGFCLASGVMISGNAQTTKRSFAALEQFSESVQALAARIAPSVVQISVSRYAPREETTGGTIGLVLGKQQGIGSGIIVDPDGYIITNAHVVAGAQRIRVTMVAARPPESAGGDQLITNELAQPFVAPVDATLVGIFKEADLALLKIAKTGLPALPYADYNKLRQGQVVFAFGSRDGLSNSVSMGVVSSISRQPDPDSPFIYIQTDAPINPGDSGGPLVNTEGEIVGLNTFILTQSGGSEGIAFAIPSPLLQVVADQLRTHGHFRRLMMGIGVQTVTPALAGGLELKRGSGVLVSDVTPDSPADIAGVKLNDIILTIDRKPIPNLPMFMMASLTHAGNEPVHLQILRGAETIMLDVAGVQEEHSSDRLSDLVDPIKGQIPALGVLGISIDKRVQAILPQLRSGYGVLVVARSATFAGNPIALQAGDVIHEVNGVMVTSVEALRGKLEQMKHGDPVALYIEREGKLQYVSFELE
jgi:serine protease Do